MMKICYIAGTLGKGGAEQQLFNQVKLLLDMGKEVVIITFSKEEYWEASLISLGVDISNIPTNNNLLRLLLVLKAATKKSPDLIISSLFYTNFYAAFVGFFLRKPSVGAVRSDLKFDLQNSGIFSSLNLHSTKYLAANSKKALLQIGTTRNSASRGFYLPNALLFDQNFRVKHTRSDKTHISMVARMVRHKRFDLFINVALKILQNDRYNVDFYCVGDGVLKRSLETWVDDLGWRNKGIYFFGEVDNVEEIYSKTDILIHLSDYEGFPNTIMEAMSFGIPVIASNVGGIPELVKNGKTGYIVENHDLDDLNEKLIMLLNDDDLRERLGNTGRKFILKNHSCEQLKKTLNNLLDIWV